MTAALDRPSEPPAGRLHARRPRSSRRRARRSGRSPAARGRDPAPLLLARARAIAPTAIAGPAWSRSRASASWRASCIRRPTPGHEGRRPTRPRRIAPARWSSSCCWPTSPRANRPTTPTRSSGDGPSGSGVDLEPVPRARPRPGADRSHPAMAVQLDACIQCSLCVRACREVQVNDVIGMADRGPRREGRLRLRRPDGPEHLRRLRRVRPGLPDRRLDARLGARRRGHEGRTGPTARSRASAPIAASAASSRIQIEGDRDPRTSRAATGRRTTTGSASRAGSGSTTSTIPTA